MDKTYLKELEFRRGLYKLMKVTGLVLVVDCDHQVVDNAKDYDFNDIMKMYVHDWGMIDIFDAEAEEICKVADEVNSG